MAAARQMPTTPNPLGLSQEQLLRVWPRLVVSEDVEAYIYFTEPDGEFDIRLSGDGIVDTLFIYRDSPLLSSLQMRFDMDRDKVRSQFGVPERTGTITSGPSA